jgi:hypothetical protein
VAGVNGVLFSESITAEGARVRQGGRARP